MSLDTYRFFSRFSWLLIFLVVALLYAMGAGIARYLGTPLAVDAYLLGQAWVIALQLATYFLYRYFDLQTRVENLGRTMLAGLPYRSGFVLLAAVFLTITASLSVLLINSGRLTQAAFVILILGFLGAIFYAIPPIQLASSGYGELTSSILVANLVPTFAFLLQFGDFHRVLAMATFPITMLHLAMMLVFGLPDYASHIKRQKRTLLIRMGWENAMTLHNILILVAFLLVGLAAVFGFPAFAAFPAFLPLPLGLLQIWYINRIANGIKPNWNALTFASVVLFTFMVYVMTFAFWTH